jgi:alpha-glucuronidase
VNRQNEDGYELWLRYREVDDPVWHAQYCQAIQNVVILGESETVEIIRREITRALPSLLGQSIPISNHHNLQNSLVIGSIEELDETGIPMPEIEQDELGDEGFLIQSHPEDSRGGILIAAKTEIAALTGTYHFLRLLQTHQDIRGLSISSCPRIHRRILAHWDNLDGSIERGYAGNSLWQWDELPDQIDPRYHDYARACASVGINGAILNNVNPQAESLSTEYLLKTAALADVFRPYGLQLYLTPVFSAPMQLGELPTADPRDPQVAAWWQEKVAEIYSLIPDFGGFQVKANSEGQPGPQDYGANHADGANMLAKILQPYGGLVLWRAFVYDTSVDADRAKCAYKELVPLDGTFEPNVVVQVKNGPIDFQPREPFSPVFGAMPKTPLALELQIAQEYLGQSIHLVYLAEMWKEVLDAETYAIETGATVAQIADGSAWGHDTSVIVAVANTGSDRNWCGHHFSQANWYAFGRLAWDHQLSAAAIAEEWIRATWSNDTKTVDILRKTMMESWPACIDYMTPLGLHHLVAEGHHYGPDPGLSTAPREDWNNTYFHKADAVGLGFDRSKTGSNAVSQYHPPLDELFDDPDTCPEEYLLWFHHIPWDYRMQSGHTLWEELRFRYQRGVAVVEEMLQTWENLRTQVDTQRYEHVLARLNQQFENARLWRDVCLDYFSGFTNPNNPPRNGES